MATYITMINYTPQGVRGFRETAERADAFTAIAEKAGVKVQQIYWTIGAHDGILILDAPDEQTVAGVLLNLASYGNVHTQTMRAFDRTEIDGVIAKAT